MGTRESKMKPLYSSKIRLSRCPCCQSKYGKHNSGNKIKTGNRVARQLDKLNIKKAMKEE